MDRSCTLVQDTRNEPRNDQVFDLRYLGVLLWKKKILVILVSIALSAIAVGATFLMPRQYTAHVTLLPMRGGDQWDVLGQFAGFPGIPQATNASYEDLFPLIIESTEVLSPLLEMSWKHMDHADEVSLATIFNIHAEPDDPRGEERVNDALMSILRHGVFSMSHDRMSGFMVLKATAAKDPGFSSALANALVGSLESYLQRSNRQQASSQADFIRERILFNEERLNAAEKEVSDFAARNKAYAASPRLTMQFNILKREAEAQLATWVELRRQLEIAIIEENNSTAALKVLDTAHPPLVPSSPNRRLALVLGAMLGAFMAMIFVIWTHRYRHA